MLAWSIAEFWKLRIGRDRALLHQVGSGGEDLVVIGEIREVFESRFFELERALAALVATALDGQTAGARRHPGAEAVGAGALALLGLIGPLHGTLRILPAAVHTLSPDVHITRR